MNARATRTACIVASVPEFVKRMTSMVGMRRVRISASRISCSLGPGKDMPSAAVSWMALTTWGLAWPRIRLV